MDQDQMHKEVAQYMAPLLNAVERWVEFVSGQVNECQSAAQAVEETPTATAALHPFAEEVGEAVATLSQNFFDFFDTMQNVYARQRGDARRDSVPTRDDLVFRLFERWRLTGGPVGNAATQKQQIIAELEALFAPAPAEPDFSAAVCKAVVDSDRLKQLTKDIDDVLITLTDDDKTFDRRRAASRLIMSMIERFTTND
ncbi:hypothetical protein [Herpetosiphon giganteus]|uniref:hypothetical protein n=1 Tax=Herpetosiphon giganteus TaxID=2029754 RepID=UPI001957F051|nr:hypothetical protein [Herpetosiphon giganteus]MBM7843759.1 hypothetical protein [Herpetosiphon giganteus]